VWYAAYAADAAGIKPRASGDIVQKTVSKQVKFEGVGLHSGIPARLVIKPASVDHGIVFVRSDLTQDNILPARWDLVDQSPLCTKLVNDAGVSLSTVEHVMAALTGCGITNAYVTVDGPEAPILDGSSAEFVSKILQAGIQAQNGGLRALEILRPVEVIRGDAFARLVPGQNLSINFEIDFTDAAIGRQSKTMSMANGAFVRELSDCRTFCRQSDVDMMRSQGLALGGTYENAVVVDGDKVLSPGGLRRADEAVRHKMLDALGDLALAGAPILGRYEGYKAGHALTNQLLRAVFADPSAYQWQNCTAQQAAKLPGAGVKSADLYVAA
jgi:UDP-3-O-[3-hydroxymyristoyl] N-acetylglucosamine deacetylase